MAIDRIAEMFAEAAAGRRSRLLPYLTSGFPDRSATAALIRRADRAGVVAVEVGVPFSDSIADGPVIQNSFYEALAGGHRVEHAFELAGEVRAEVSCALITMVSYSIVHRCGPDLYFRRAVEAGYDGIILPDVPVEEAAPCAQLAGEHGLAFIGLIAPSTPPERGEGIAKLTTGFLYRMAVAGTTGERDELPEGLAEEVGELRRRNGLPVCVGFGISRPEQVETVCRWADGAIVGSAVVRRIGQAVEAGDDEATEVVGTFIDSLAAAAFRAGS